MAEEMKPSLPHLYGWKFYPWARKFFNSTNKMNLLCAANQISKSSIMIRKAIHWATAPALWPKLWSRPPLTFVYGYPTKDVATLEWKKKWVPEFMPKEALKNHPIYGWKAEFSNGKIHSVNFNSNVSIFFKTYAMDVQDLQTVSSWSHFIDEELPDDLYSELQFRLAATDGYWHGVFTPTLGQEFWRQAIEEHGQYERFKGAMKQQVSMYDCLYYDDGTRSPWTEEQIKRAENSCKSEAEKLRRVFGRFVIDEGLKYPAFIRSEHFKKYHPVPKTWLIYVGCDPGSGGDNHPAAVCIVAVAPDFTMGRVIRGWRGDGVVTTVSDVVSRAKVMVSEVPLQVGAIKYDWASRDFYTISQEMGLDAQPAEKSHAIGEQVINVLFRNNMLYVYDLPELEPLAVELSTLKLSTPKQKAKDDFADAFRYAVTAIPWDWSAINGKKELPNARQKSEMDLRRENFFGSGEELTGVEDEMSRFNDLCEGYGGDDEFEGFEF